jgi:hypothetical protein
MANLLLACGDAILHRRERIGERLDLVVRGDRDAHRIVAGADPSRDSDERLQMPREPIRCERRGEEREQQCDRAECQHRLRQIVEARQRLRTRQLQHEQRSGARAR